MQTPCPVCISFEAPSVVAVVQTFPPPLTKRVIYPSSLFSPPRHWVYFFPPFFCPLPQSTGEGEKNPHPIYRPQLPVLLPYRAYHQKRQPSSSLSSPRPICEICL